MQELPAHLLIHDLETSEALQKEVTGSRELCVMMVQADESDEGVKVVSDDDLIYSVHRLAGIPSGPVFHKSGIISALRSHGW